MSTTKFSKDNKIALAQLMQVQFKCSCSLSKIYKFLRHQNATGIMLLLNNNVHEKTSWRVKINKIRKCLQAICNLQSCYNFEFVLHENVLIFNQPNTCNFFMYIITIVTLFHSLISTTYVASSP